MIVNSLEYQIIGDPADDYYRAFRDANQYGDDITEFLKSTVQSGWTCFDVGANIGLTSIFMASSATNVKVFAFEPSPVTLRYLSANAANAGNEIKVIPLAVGDKKGNVDFTELPGFGAGSHILAAGGKHPGMQDASTISVPVITLDEWCCDNAIERLDLLKIDVEGYEINVLRGAKETLRRFRPLVILEFNSWFMVQVQHIAPAAILEELFDVFSEVSLINGDGSVSRLSNDHAGHSEYLAQNEKRVVDNLLCLI